MKFLNCLVTGASSGIGAAVSIELSKSAKHIYIVARNIKKLEEVHDKIIKNDCECTIVPLDLCEENGIENLASQILKKDQFLDILILSSGRTDQLSPVDSIDTLKLNNIINLNYLSNFRLIKSMHPLLKNSKDSRVALISSFKDKNKEQYWGIFQPIMTALNELIMTYAIENKNTNIKVNVFCPEAVNTKSRAIMFPGENKNNISSTEEIAIKIINYLLKTKSTGNLIKI